MSQKVKLAALAVALVGVGVGYVVLRAIPSRDPAVAPAAVERDDDVQRSARSDGARTQPRATERESLAPPPTEATAAQAPRPDLAGRVLTPDGRPAVDARVVLGATGALQFLEAGEEPPDELVWTATDDEGRFELFDVLAGDVPAGAVRLTAGAEESAPSETALVELVEDQPKYDLLLVLRAGVRIHGEVLRKDGSPAAARAVRFLQGAAGGRAAGKLLMRSVTTDELGRFDERHLCPGTWGLLSFPDEEEVERFGGDMTEDMLQATVELADGEERLVILGAPSAEAVTVHGRVTMRGEPAGALMQWMGECDDPMGSQRIADIDDEGRYRVELPRPGGWYVRLMGGGAHEEEYLDVPAVSEHERDFALPCGEVRGRVLDSLGAPIEGAQVSHVLVAGAPHRTPLAAAGDSASSAADGSYRLTCMRAGVYELGVAHPDYAARALAEVRVGRDEVLAGLDLMLEPGRALRGRVLDAHGLPVVGAPLWIHDAHGRLVNPITRTVSGAEGRFETPRLASGRYALLTQVGLQTAQVVGVELTLDAPPEVELRLSPGASLVVECYDDGELSRAHVRVRDLDRRLYTGLRSLRDPWSWQRYPFDSKRPWLGPLPAGTYRVSAHLPSRGLLEREVTLTPGETRELRFER